jgi:YVTN family beta-propeller protein
MWRSMAMRSVPAILIAGLFMLGGFHVAEVPTSPFGLLSEGRRGENRLLDGAASAAPAPDSGGGTVVVTVPVGSGPFGVAYDSRNGYVYVANQGANYVSVISGTAVVGTVRVGNGPGGVAHNGGNGYVYVANPGSNNVSVISGTTVVGTVRVGGGPHGVGYDSRNEYVYVANFGSDTVSVFSTITPPLVTFTESGLLSGTPWSLTLHGASDSSTTTTITFSAPNGTYYFAVGGISGYTASPASASVTVNGTPVHVAISFSVTKYAVTFNETGLPSMTSWTVTLGGATQSSTAGNITFIKPNGTYPFSVGPVAGYAVSPASGNVNVSGKATNETISFNAVFLGLPVMRGYALLAVIVMLVVVVGVVSALGWVSRKRRVPPSPP